VAEGWTLMADVSWLPPPPRAGGVPAGGAAGPADEGADPAAVDSFAMTTVLGPVPVAEAVDRYGGDLDAEANPTRAVRVLSALAGLLAMEGAFDAARDHLDRAREILEQRGLRVRAVALAYLAGFVELLADSPSRAEELLERGRADCERMGERRVLAHLTSLLAHAVYAQGRYVEAVQLGEAGAEAVPGDEVAAVTARAARAKALARLAMADEARAVAHEAVAAAPAELPMVRAGALLDLADVLEAVGEPQAATAAAQEALTLYRRKGATVLAARAEALLQRLTPPLA
jgi:tetratricopeptide (TPR) repeat protein